MQGSAGWQLSAIDRKYSQVGADNFAVANITWGKILALEREAHIRPFTNRPRHRDAAQRRNISPTQTSKPLHVHEISISVATSLCFSPHNFCTRKLTDILHVIGMAVHAREVIAPELFPHLARVSSHCIQQIPRPIPRQVESSLCFLDRKESSGQCRRALLNFFSTHALCRLARFHVLAARTLRCLFVGTGSHPGIWTSEERGHGSKREYLRRLRGGHLWHQ